MKEFVSSVSPKGQITIPAEIRKRLRLKPKDKVAIILEDQGEVRLEKARFADLEALRGAAGSLPQPLSWKEMEEIAHEDRLEAAGGKE